MIFLSHNHNDKPVIEPIAIRLAEIFGKGKVFYDDWSIQPGDGIIQKMNEGLRDPKFVFFFVSKHSLHSKVVDLEWQTAVFKATQGECKIVPVKTGDVEMPPVLLQNLYIDLFSDGIEATIHNIVSVIQGNSTFTPRHAGFSNLTFSVKGRVKSRIQIFISASHLMEPNPNFLVLLDNKEEEVLVRFSDNLPSKAGFNKNIKLADGKVANGFFIAPLGGAITPAMPMHLTIDARRNSEIVFVGLLHQKTPQKFDPVSCTKVNLDA